MHNSLKNSWYSLFAVCLISSIAISGCLKTETPKPLFKNTASFETTMPQHDDPADIYYPVVEGLAKGFCKFPIALFLQGGRVDKQYYSKYAHYVASYGFIVVVPNHFSTISIPGFNASGLFSEQKQFYDILEFMKDENVNADSPIKGLVDTSTLVGLGHSYGAACTINAIQNLCEPTFCPAGETFSRPEELKAIALTGINTKPYGVPGDTTIRDTHNMGMPIAFINGAIETRAVYDVSITSYGMIDDPPKMLVEVKGANHFGMCDMNNPPGPGKDSAEPTIDREVSIETYARWTALFLRAYALHDKEAFMYINKTGKELDPNVEVWSD
jgi:predicted dienelactone hydrolase